MPIKHLNQVQLADRWNISPRTLERWRGEGPRHLKIGGCVAYRLVDIEAYEAAQLRLAEPESRPSPAFGTAGKGRGA